MIFTQCRSFSAFTECVVLWNSSLNDSSVKNTSVSNFYKKIIVWQFNVRSHVTQHLGDTSLSLAIRFENLTTFILRWYYTVAEANIKKPFMKISMVKTYPCQQDATVILSMWHSDKVRFKDIPRITYTDIK